MGVLTALLAFPVSAQSLNDVPPLVERVRVEVVNVDVVVTDRNGVPVSGLAPDDFVVYEDGEEREISNFFSFVNGRAAADGEPDEKEAQPENLNLKRRMAILFDTNSLEKGERDEAVESLERFISEQFDGTYEWSVIAYGDRLRMLQPFTSDKLTVLGSLASLRRLQLPLKQARAADQTFTEHPVLSSRVFARGLRPALDMPEPAGIGPEEFELRERMLQGLQRFGETAAAMVETMRAYSVLPGRKSLVFVGGSMDMLPGGSQLVGYGYPGVGGGDRVDPLLASVNAQIMELHQAIIRTANASGFAIYPVTGEAGLEERAPFVDVAREGSASFNAVVPPSLTQIDVDSAPKIMAEGTGGVHYTSRRYYNAFDAIDHRTANAYVLGFTTDHAPDGEYHKIRVETRTRGLEVKYREGYQHLSKIDRIAEELATPLVFPKNRGDFEVEAQVHLPELDDTESGVTIAGAFPIEAVTLVPQGDSVVGRVFLFVGVYNEDGSLNRLVREYQDVRIPSDRAEEFPPGSAARFGVDVGKLDPGIYTFTMTVMDEVTERFGTGLQWAEI
jgi:VWFA-related protein